MHLYQGVDIVEIERLRALLGRDEGFAAAIFTERELAYCGQRQDRIAHLAGRFAAKEACLKALGIGLSTTGAAAGLLDIEVVNRASGRPELLLRGWPARLCTKRGIDQRTVSISHTRTHAVATVVLLGTAAVKPAPAPRGGRRS